MEVLKYKVIKSREQYDEYCQLVEELVSQGAVTSEVEEEIELLTVLIEKYDQENNSFEEVDPIQLLISLMEEHSLKAKDLVNILKVSKGLVSDILNYKKGLSKEVIRKLADHFSMNQDAFNRPYKLKVDPKLRNASVMNTKKELEVL
ncbi:helix-turn-helix domain-containing protein [Marinoscillum sp.]|uniref:helix-turn-helix domain-containing protein n=1 Tax=Marinoscillum sp. TaxID=2024838 RepID=UPI003BAD9DB0